MPLPMRWASLSHYSIASRYHRQSALFGLHSNVTHKITREHGSRAVVERRKSPEVGALSWKRSAIAKMLLQTAAALFGHQRDDSTSFLRCYTDGRFDVTKFINLKRKQRDDEFEDAAHLLTTKDYDDDDWGANDPPTAEERKKRKKRIILARRTEDGELEAILPTETMWYHMYVSCPNDQDKRFLHKFRRRFRLPYHSWLEFVEDAKEGNWFPRWMAGKDSSPLELLILGAFRYLGRGWTFDDLEEATGISEEVHRCFFHKFIEVGSTILFDKYVVTPTNADEAARHKVEFELAGMPGTPGSSDATHIIHEMCSWRLRRSHKGGKLKQPVRSYNMTVNHRRRILGTTRGHPGSWNDKSVVL